MELIDQLLNNHLLCSGSGSDQVPIVHYHTCEPFASTNLEDFQFSSGDLASRQEVFNFSSGGFIGIRTPHPDEFSQLAFQQGQIPLSYNNKNNWEFRELSQ